MGLYAFGGKGFRLVIWGVVLAGGRRGKMGGGAWRNTPQKNIGVIFSSL